MILLVEVFAFASLKNCNETRLMKIIRVGIAIEKTESLLLSLVSNKIAIAIATFFQKTVAIAIQILESLSRSLF